MQTKNLVVIGCFLSWSFTTHAQSNSIVDNMSQYNVSVHDLEAGLKDANAIFRFEVSIMTIMSGDTSIQMAAFEPTVPVSEKWVMEGRDGFDPTKKEIRLFYKTHNTVRDGVDAKIISDSWKTESEDDNFLMVSFMYEKSSLPRKYHFLADTRGLAQINKNARRLNHVIFKNNNAQKVKQYKVTAYRLFMKYYYDGTDKIYLIEREDLTMDTKSGKVEEITRFKDYRPAE